MKKRKNRKGAGLILVLLLAALLGLLVLRVLKDSATPAPSAQPTEGLPAEQLPAEPEPEQETPAPEEDEDGLTNIQIETPEEATAAAQQTQAEPSGGVESAPAAPAVSTGGSGPNETVAVPFVIYD